MKSIDDSSDLDDLPLSSLGIKAASKKNHNDLTTEETLPHTKTIKSQKKAAIKNSDEKPLKGSTNMKSKKKSPSPKRKAKQKEPIKSKLSKSPKGSKRKNTRKSEQSARKEIKSNSKNSWRAESDEQISSSISSKIIITASSQLYSACDKGKLIQHCLCRWWYAYTWPDPDSLPQSNLEGCDALDGFPGVYVATSGPNVGQIFDFRDKDTVSNCIRTKISESLTIQEILKLNYLLSVP